MLPRDLYLDKISPFITKQDIAALLENVVYLELLRRGYRVFTGKLDNLEVDFIAEKEGRPLYLQVTYLLATEKTVEREFKPLTRIPDNYPKMVLSLDPPLWGSDRNGIARLNLIDFLLDEQDR